MLKPSLVEVEDLEVEGKPVRQERKCGWLYLYFQRVWVSSFFDVNFLFGITFIVWFDGWRKNIYAGWQRIIVVRAISFVYTDGRMGGWL